MDAGPGNSHSGATSREGIVKRNMARQRRQGCCHPARQGIASFLRQCCTLQGWPAYAKYRRPASAIHRSTSIAQQIPEAYTSVRPGCDNHFRSTTLPVPPRGSKEAPCVRAADQRHRLHARLSRQEPPLYFRTCGSAADNRDPLTDADRLTIGQDPGPGADGCHVYARHTRENAQALAKNASTAVAHSLRALLSFRAAPVRSFRMRGWPSC